MASKHIYKPWHYYFTRTLKSLLGRKHFTINSEVSVGKLPLKIDIIIIKKEHNYDTSHLADPFKHFNDINVIEFKSPEASFGINELDKLLAYALLYKIKNNIPERKSISLFSFTSCSIEPLNPYFQQNKWEIKELEKGIYYSNIGFNFYFVKLNALDEINENLPFFIYTKIKNQEEVFKKLFSTYKNNKNILDASFLLQYDLIKNIRRDTMPTVFESKELMRELVQDIIKEYGEDEIIDKIGEEKFIKKIGAESIIQRIGEENIIQKIGEENIIQKIGEENIIRSFLRKKGYSEAEIEKKIKEL